MSGPSEPRLLRRIWLRLLATLGVSAAVMLSWWWRVEDARTPEQVSVIALGQAIELGRSLATPLRLEIRRDAGQPETLALSMVLENVTGETQKAYFGSPPTPPELIMQGHEIAAPEIILKKDGETLIQLEPRIPEEVELIWTLPPGGMPENAPMRIMFSREIFKLRDNLYGRSSWLGMEPAATLEVLPKASS